MDQEDWAGCVHFGLDALLYDPADEDTHLPVGEAYLSLQEQEAGLRHPATATLIDCGKRGRVADAVRIHREVVSWVSDPGEKRQLCWELGWNCFLADQYAAALEYTDRAIACHAGPGRRNRRTTGMVSE